MTRKVPYTEQVMRDSFIVGVYPGLGTGDMDYIAGAVREKTGAYAHSA